MAPFLPQNSIYSICFSDDPLAHMTEIMNPTSEVRQTPQPSSATNSQTILSQNPDFKLSVTDLNKSPEEVFDIVAKVGEGSVNFDD